MSKLKTILFLLLIAPMLCSNSFSTNYTTDQSLQKTIKKLIANKMLYSLMLIKLMMALFILLEMQQILIMFGICLMATIKKELNLFCTDV